MNPTRVVIKEVPRDARREVINGKTYLRGRTLATYLDDFGGFEGEVTQPTTGHRFAVSLAQVAWLRPRVHVAGRELRHRSVSPARVTREHWRSVVHRRLARSENYEPRAGRVATFADPRIER
jgi:hypothetical protein